MELDIIKSQTTWNDASQSINLNFAKIRQALASSGGGGGNIDALISTVYDISYLGSISTNDNSATFNAYAIDSLYKRIVLLENKEVDLTGYATETWVLAKNYITAAALSPYLKTADANSTFATLAALNALSNRFDALDDALNDNVSGKINTWNEIVDFLDEYNGSKDLATILSGMNADIALRLKTADFDAWKTDVYSPLASRVSTAESNISTHTTQISGLTTRMGNAETNISTNAKGIADNKTAIATNKSNISANATAITNLGKRVAANEGNIAKILKWFAVDSDGNLYTTYNFYSTKEISANGLSIGSGSSGGGLISQVYGITAFGTIASESNSATFNAYAIDSLYKRIVSLEGKATAVSFVPAMTSGKQIGTLSIDGVSTVLYGVDAYSKADADGTFLKLWGGTISVSGYYGLRLKSTAQDAAALAFENKDSVSGYLMYAGGSDWKVTAANWGATYNLLHSNNYSQYALPLTGGTIKNGDNGTPLVIDTTHTEIGVPFRINNINKGWVGHTASIGTYLYDYTSKKFIGVKTDGTPVYYDGSHRTLYHTGNFNPANYLPVNGGAIGAGNSNSFPLTISSTSAYTGIAFATSGGTAYMRYQGGSTWGVTDNGWNNSYTLIHSGNYSQYALPLSGGTLTGKLTTGQRIVLKGSILELCESSGSGGIMLWNGVSSGDGVRNLMIYDGSSWNKAIHSGNIGSQSVDKATRLHTGGGGTDLNELLFSDYSLRYYSAISSETLNIPDKTGWQNALLALPLHGNGVTAQFYFTANKSQQLYYRSTQVNAWKTIAFTDSNVASADVIATAYANQSIDLGKEGKVRMIYGTASNATSLGYPRQYTSGLSVLTGYTGWQMVTYGGTSIPNPYFRSLLDNGTFSDWKQLAFLTDNVASATKLQTARTIWGQSFDGSGNVSGTLYDVNNIYPNSAAERYIGTSSNPFKYVYAEWFGSAANSNLAFGANNAVHMVINSSGNVTIGSSDLAGSLYKLYVDGQVRASKPEYPFYATIPTATAKYRHAFGGYSELTQGQYLTMEVGHSSKSKNTAYFGYYHDGDGSNANRLTLGMHSVDEVINITGAGNVGIGTTNPELKLDVNGATRVGSNTDGGTLLRFNMDRPWAFVQRGTGGSSELALMPLINDKVFAVVNYQGAYVAKFACSSTPAITFGGSVTVDSSLNVGTVINVGSNIMPKTNETSYLGSTSLRFLAVCAKIGDFSGAVTMYSTLTVAGISTFEQEVRHKMGIRPNANDARYVGTSSYRFNEGYINNMYTNAMYVGKGTAYGFKSDGSINATAITANSGVKVASGQALTFLDASGKEHKLTYDSTAGAFKFDGNILVLGDGQFNAIN